jgi:hypothetical protein
MNPIAAILFGFSALASAFTDIFLHVSVYAAGPLTLVLPSYWPVEMAWFIGALIGGVWMMLDSYWVLCKGEP